MINRVKKKTIVKNIQNIQNVQSNDNNSPVPNANTMVHRAKNKTQDDPLFLENDGLRKENENYKNKLKAIEVELKNIKNENSKLREENTSELQEKIKEKDAEIEKLKIMDKDRIAVLAELEQKNRLNVDLNNQMQLLQNECLEKDKTIESSESRVQELNKQIEIKDIARDEMIKLTTL